MIRRGAVFLLIACVLPGIAEGQGVDGHVSLMANVFPSIAFADGDDRAVSELRARVLLERRFEIRDGLRMTTSAFADGLVARRRPGSTTTAGILRPQEVHLEASWQHADLRIGFSRVAWGRLDELQPTDVVNPQDVARFFLEGRTEARLPVAMLRGRWLPSDRFALEAIYVPVFRRGVFDQLDQDTSPFNLAPVTPAVVVSEEPAKALRNAQGGLRASATTGRVDWAISVYRGFEPLPVYQVRATPDVPETPVDPIPDVPPDLVPNIVPIIDERHPRFTMIGGDFETVRGEWGIRGEAAMFIERELQAAAAPIAVEGRAFEGGLGVDRKAGVYRISGNVLLSRRWADSTLIDRTDVTLVAAIDRSFQRETRSVRLFGVYNPSERSAFARAIVTINLRDNVALELSGGAFSGTGDDALSLFASRDFVYTRLKVFF